jgi:hypothetical protein
MVLLLRVWRGWISSPHTPRFDESRITVNVLLVKNQLPSKKKVCQSGCAFSPLVFLRFSGTFFGNAAFEPT